MDAQMADWLTSLYCFFFFFFKGTTGKFNRLPHFWTLAGWTGGRDCSYPSGTYKLLLRRGKEQRNAYARSALQVKTVGETVKVLTDVQSLRENVHPHPIPATLKNQEKVILKSNYLSPFRQDKKTNSFCMLGKQPEIFGSFFNGIFIY